jgi:hypothetical protein
MCLTFPYFRQEGHIHFPVPLLIPLNFQIHAISHAIPFLSSLVQQSLPFHFAIKYQWDVSYICKEVLSFCVISFCYIMHDLLIFSCWLCRMYMCDSAFLLSITNCGELTFGIKKLQAFRYISSAQYVSCFCRTETQTDNVPQIWLSEKVFLALELKLLSVCLWFLVYLATLSVAQILGVEW